MSGEPTPASTGDGWLADVDASTLLDDSEQFDEQLTAGGVFAVVGAPFAGRERVLDRAAATLEATRISLDPGADPDAVLERLGDGPLVVGNCQHLYNRTVGGFEGLDPVLEALAGTDYTVVTGWNRYAWSYLDAVRDAAAVVDEQFDVAGLSRPELATLARSHASTLPTFRMEDRERSLVAIRRYPVGWRDLTVPVLVPDWEEIGARLSTAPDPETAVFERLTALAGGNPGVAAALWRRRRAGDGDEMRPSDIDAPAVDLDREGALLLRIVLAGEAVDRDLLAERFGARCDRVLGRLDRNGVVGDGDTVRLEPAGVPAAVEVTERWRIL